MSDELFMFRVIFYLLVANILASAMILFYIRRTKREIEKAVKIMSNMYYDPFKQAAGMKTGGGSIVGMAKYPPQ